MDWKLKVAFFCHLLASLLLITFGLIYLLRSEFMPYHAVAVGKSWTEVGPAFQILILAFMRVAGGSFLATACAVIILLKPFRQGLRWTYWAIPVIGLTSFSPIALCNDLCDSKHACFTAMDGCCIGILIIDNWFHPICGLRGKGESRRNERKRISRV